MFNGKGELMRGRGLVVVMLAVTALVVAPTAGALLSEQAVFSSARNELSPAADWNGATSILGWAKSRAGQPNRYDAWVKEGSAAAVKLNGSGQGFMGGIDYPNVVYQQVASGNSNLRLYDLGTHTRPAVPSGVNTAKWEWHPTISGDWLLFNRDDTKTSTQRVVLKSLSTPEQRVVDSVSRSAYDLAANQVNGDWAVYTRCKPGCNVVRYRISTQAKKTMPKPATTRPRYQYGGSVASDGTVYLLRSGSACGSSIKIVRYGAGDPPTGTVVAALPKGKDSRFTFARENPDTSIDVFYERVGCTSAKWDVYKVVDP
jgi:hypothetical protein